MDPQKVTEKAITETLYRHIYYGRQIYAELAVLQDIIEPTNQKALDFVRSWLLLLKHDEIYRMLDVQNNFLDLHHLIVSYIPSEDQLNTPKEVLPT